MANDDLQFTISWDGGARARIHFVIDNDVVVADDSDDDYEGEGEITIPYKRAHAAIHVVKWSLYFPGASASNLLAKLTINGAAPVTLHKEKSEQKNVWVSSGAAP
jgi:hypothetical protein